MSVFTDWKFWILFVLAGIALLYSLMNIQTRMELVAKQQQVLAQQGQINQAQQLSKFNSNFIRALANLAAQTNDANITQLLADHGVTFQVSETQAEGRP